MKLIRLTCGNCGAPIEVRKHARLVVCPFCDTHLKVIRSDGAIYAIMADVISKSARELDVSAERLDGAASDLQNNVNVLRAENAIMELDEEWRWTMHAMSRSSRIGQPRLPTRSGAVLMVMAAVIVLSAYFLLAEHWSRWFTFPVFAGVVFLAWLTWSDASEFRDARTEYVRRRQALMAELGDARSALEGR